MSSTSRILRFTGLLLALTDLSILQHFSFTNFMSPS